MAVHYLLDLFDNPVATAKLNDVHVAKDGRSLCVGNFIVRVPGDVQIDNPRTVAELVTQKYQGLLAYYTGFQHITYDDLLDTSHVDITASVGMFGSRSTIALSPGVGLFQSLPIPLPLPPGAPAPAQVLIVWETFTYEDTDPANARFQRTYVETSPDDITCQVNFQGLMPSLACADGEVLNVPIADRGTNLLVRFVNTTDSVVHLGSWAVIY